MVKNSHKFLSIACLALGLFGEVQATDEFPYLVAGGRGSPFSPPHFSDRDDVISFLDDHLDIKGIGLVDHTCFPKMSLTFLNNYPHIKTLVLNGVVANPAEFELHTLQYITVFHNGLRPRDGHRHDPIWQGFGNVPNLEKLDTTLEHFPYLGEMPFLQKLRLTEQDTHLYAPYNIQNIGRYNLRELSIHAGHLTDISPLGQLTGLESLWIYGFQITSEGFEFLHQLRALKLLEIQDSRHMDLSILKGHPAMETLVLDMDPYYKETACPQIFETLPSLKSLTLRWNSLKDISALSACKKLEVLVLYRTKISSLEALRGLPIRHLDISLCNVKDLSPISDMKSLELLDIVCNYPHHWDGLKAHPSLRRIKAAKGDLINPTKIAGSDYGENVTWDSKYFLTAESKKFIEEYDTNIPNIPEGYPLEVLKTVPHLEMIVTTSQEITPTLLENFRQARPDVAVVECGPWQTVDIDSIRKYEAAEAKK